MKIYLALILSCVSALAADTNDIRLVTTFGTSTEPGILTKIDTFTRAGQANLVCNTLTKDGVLQIRTHQFYHDGLLVGEYSTNNLYTYDRSSFISVASAPYGISFNLDSSNKLSAFVTDTNHLILESYSCTNGIFYPADSSFIANLNGMIKDKLVH